MILIHTDPSSKENVLFGRAAEKLWDQILTVATPLVSLPGMKKLVRFLGVCPKYGKEYPLVRLIERRDDRIYKYSFEGEVTEENILRFYSDFKTGILRPYFKSQEAPEIDDGAAKTLVGDTFNKEVLDKQRDVIVFFHSIWCLECPDIMPIYENLAIKFGGYSDLVFSKIDCFDNEGQLIPEATSGDPIIRLYKVDNKKEPIEFEGNFVESEIESWLRKHIVLPGDL